MDRFRPVGSDHFAITATFAIDDLDSSDSTPEHDDLHNAREMIAEGTQEAQVRDDAASTAEQ